MKTEVEEYIKDRLDEWANWYGRGRDNHLGYPSKCPLARLMDGELLINNNGGPKGMPTNERADEIENLVKEMAQQNKNMALALRCQYFIQGSSRAKAKPLECSYAQFRIYIEMAIQWLAGRLTGKYRINKR